MVQRIITTVQTKVFLRSWAMTSLVYSVASVCPCCGKQGCPTGFGISALVGGILTFLGAMFAGLKRIGVKH